VAISCETPQRYCVKYANQGKPSVSNGGSKVLNTVGFM